MKTTIHRNCEVCRREILEFEDWPDNTVKVVLNEIKQPYILAKFDSKFYKDFIYIHCYELFKMCQVKIEKNIEIYICDNCVDKLINEDKLIVYNNEWNNVNRFIENIGEDLVNSGNIYRSVPRTCLSLKLTKNNIDYITQILNAKLRNNTYYNIGFNMLDEDKDLFYFHIKLKEEHLNNTLFQTRNIKLYNNHYIVFYSSIFDFNVLSETEFKRRFTFVS